MAKRVATAGGGWVLRKLADRLVKRGHARLQENGELLILMDVAAEPAPAPPPKPVYDPVKHHAVAVDQRWIDLRTILPRWGRGDGKLS
jgi:hypothetical protein